MPSIKLCENELTALFGLPHLAIVLYMLGLRPRMDFATGTVGVRPLISWQALREATYVEPHPGIKHEYASAQAVRRAAGWLEKVGLIRMRSRDRQLVFFLPLAETDYSVRNKADRGPTDQADRGPTDHFHSESGPSDPASRQTEIEKADKHPVSGKEVNTSPYNFIGSREPEAGGGEGEISLIFPKSLTSRQKAAIAKNLSGIGADMAQSVLDELEGCMQAGSVKNIPALLRFLVEQVEKGNFIPDKGEQIRLARESATRRAQEQAVKDRLAQEQAANFVKGQGKPDLLALVGSRKRKQEEQQHEHGL
jgi:hypothetical protein